ncbi:MAG: hypothetical protein K1000chlam2_00590 [Chlamydiae bacterium]|nr:hypothetical protein [Chlamydiota bacterium]
MKKHFLALSLVATSGLIAQDAAETGTHQEQNGYCNSCCCSPCCCKPCCVPKPKKCIDCECYTPAYYDLECDWGLFLDAEFLYWYARETNLGYAAKIQAKPRTVVSDEVLEPRLVFAPNRIQNINTDWEPGFRVGVGWSSGCDGWDYFLHWTWMRNRETRSTTVDNTYALIGTTTDPMYAAEDEFLLLNPWINASFHNVNVDNNINSNLLTFDKVSARWQLQNYNSVDLEIGRKYWLSKCFTLRPYAAIRGAWHKTTFQTTSTRNFENELTSDTIAFSFKDRFRNRCWGAGILGGLQPNWHFCSNFILFSNFDVALIWGEFEAQKRETYLGTSISNGTTTIDPNYCNSFNHKFFQMTAILDTAIGFRWEECWCCDSMRSALDIGWEHHIWFDQNHRIKSYDFTSASVGASPVVAESGFRGFAEATGNLMLGGLVVRLRLDF